jgi:hypothetical protein
MFNTKKSKQTVPLTDGQLKALYGLLTERQKLSVIRRLKKAIAKSKNHYYNRVNYGRIGSKYGWQTPLHRSSEGKEYFFGARLNSKNRPSSIKVIAGNKYHNFNRVNVFQN